MQRTVRHFSDGCLPTHLAAHGAHQAEDVCELTHTAQEICTKAQKLDEDIDADVAKNEAREKEEAERMAHLQSKVAEMRTPRTNMWRASSEVDTLLENRTVTAEVFDAVLKSDKFNPLDFECFLKMSGNKEMKGKWCGEKLAPDCIFVHGKERAAVVECKAHTNVHLIQVARGQILSHMEAIFEPLEGITDIAYVVAFPTRPSDEIITMFKTKCGAHVWWAEGDPWGRFSEW